MKKILFALLLVSGIVQGQGDAVPNGNPKDSLRVYNDGIIRDTRMRPVYKLTGFDVQFFVPGYTNISSRYKWIATAVDSGLHIPQYNGVPTGTRTGVWSADGAIAADTANGYLYLYSGGGWIKFAKFSDIAAGAINIYNTSSSLTAARVVEQAGFQLMIQNAATGMYWRLQPSQGRMEFYAESNNGQKSVAFDATPDDVFMTAADSGRVYLMGVGVGGTDDGTGVLAQASRSGALSFINVKADSIAYKPHLGVMNIDTLRNWLATDVSDTTYKKPMTYDTRNGRWEYGNWHGGSGGTSGIDDVLAVGQSLSAIRTITVGGHQLILSGTASPTTLNVSNTGGGGVIWAQAATGVPITSQLNTTATNARQISILHTAGTTGTAANGFGVGESYSAEHAGGGAAVNIGEFYYYWADATNRTSYINLVGDSVALQSTYLQLQPNGIALVNNLNDTLATKAYARSVGGGGGGWGTTGTVATLTGDATLAQDGNDFVFSGGPVIINETGGDFVFRVEGDGEPNLISTYPAFDRVGIGIASTSIAYKFQVKQSTDKNIGVGSQGSEISLEAVNDAVNAAIPLGIYGSQVSVSGGGVQAILASSSSLVVNEAGADLDFRVEGDTDPNLIVADAGLDKVGIKTASPHSSLHVAGSFAKAYLDTESGITLDASHSIVEVTATGQTITLPTAVGIEGRIYTIILSASGSATVATTSSQNINGATTYSLASQYKYVTVVSNGTQWYVIANN